jgi:hypothetical protein
VGETDATDDESSERHEDIIDAAGDDGGQRRTAGPINREIDDTSLDGDTAR